MDLLYPKLGKDRTSIITK